MARIRAALAAATLLLTVPVPAVFASARPSLAGVTTISGTRSASVAVRLTKPATLRDPLLEDAARNDVGVTTAGRFGGFVLVQEGVPALSQIVVVGGRLPEPSGKLHFVYPANGLGAGTWRLPAGNYRLYLVTDGKPTTVRLRLPGLSGTTSLRPAGAASAALTFPAAAIDTDPARVTYAVGADRPVARRTLFFSTLYAGYAAHVDTVYTSCFYFERPTGPAPYAPGCPDPAERHITPISLPPDAGTPARHAVLNSFLPLVEGHYGGGTSFVSATPAETVRYLQLWLAY